MLPYFGASVYDDPAVYARSSPINFIKNVRTPTFAYVGERDIEVPAPQTEEFWHALKALNVPTGIMIYPGEGHGLRDPLNAGPTQAGLQPVRQPVQQPIERGSIGRTNQGGAREARLNEHRLFFRKP